MERLLGCGPSMPLLCMILSQCLLRLRTDSHIARSTQAGPDVSVMAKYMLRHDQHADHGSPADLDAVHVSTCM